MAYQNTDDNCSIGDTDPRLIKLMDQETRIYPNPSSGLATVDFGKKISAAIHVTNISGVLIHKSIIKNDSEITLDLSGQHGVQIINIVFVDGTVKVLKHIVIK